MGVVVKARVDSITQMLIGRTSMPNGMNAFVIGTEVAQDKAPDVCVTQLCPPNAFTPQETWEHMCDCCGRVTADLTGDTAQATRLEGFRFTFMLTYAVCSECQAHVGNGGTPYVMQGGDTKEDKE